MQNNRDAIDALVELCETHSERAELFNIQQLLIEAIKTLSDRATNQEIKGYIQKTWRWNIPKRTLTSNLSAMKKKGMIERSGRVWVLAK